MKTQQEIEDMKAKIQERIGETASLCNRLDHSSMEWYEADRQYAKLIAQYNILLEVLK